MRIGIIGAGPIGSILGAYLAKAGNEVALVDILKNHLSVIQKQGLTISGLVKMTTNVHKTFETISALKTYAPQAIFLCVKTPVLKVITPEIEQIFHSDQFVVSAQNGIDVEEEIATHFGRVRTLRLVVNYAGNLVEAGHIEMSFFNKPNYLGALVTAGEPRAKKLVQVITEAGLDTEFVPDIKKYTWEKAILNAALSPLCALTGMTMKQAMDFEGTYHMAEEILKEGIAVAKSIGYDYGPDFLDHCIQYLKNAGPHKTSMHVDIENRRPTEIDVINKKIVDYGKKKGIPTPYNEIITSLIKATEKRML